jgi:hypothetical protein
MPFDSTKLRKTKGQDGIDPNIYSGPKTMPQDLPKLTNRELREKEMMSLIRKLKPEIRKAMKTALGIMEDTEVPAATRLASAKFVFQEYKGLLGDLYKDKYDEDEGEKIQDTAPVFSLKIIKNEDSKEEPKG